MSQPSNDSNQAATPPATDSTVWPDLSAYGITLGIVTLDGDRRQLVFVDDNNRYKHIARNMGFSRTKWDGLWVRSDLRVQATAFSTAFPKTVVRRLSLADIEDTALEKIRVLVESNRQALLPGFPPLGAVDDSRGPAPKPAPTVRRLATRGADATREVLDSNEIDLSPLIAEARLMGTNLSGEEVFETPDGGRFVRFAVETETAVNERVVREMARSGADAQTSARFLRADTDEALGLCARAFVKLMAEGHTARVDELQRFFRAVTGREFTPEDPDLDRITSAVDEARVARLRVDADGQPQMPDGQMFRTALKLHDAAQYYTVVRTQRMTPLPIGVVFQHIAGAMPEGSSVRVDNAAHGEFGRFGDENSPFRLARQGESQDILLAAYSGKLLDKAVVSFGTAVAREDHASVLTSLEKMPDHGLGVFVIEGDAVPGRIGPSSRRFLDALANLREIEGIVDVDGNLMGVPGALPSRIIVVGAKREVPGHGGLPTAFGYVTDYESLWTWGAQVTEAIRKPGSVPYAERGGVAHENSYENVYQAPYIPTSMLSDPAMMVPRALASPTRRAMLNLLNETPHVDDWLQQRLQYQDRQALSAALSAEQADAVVLGVHRTDTGMGFMAGEQTGVGKGRELACFARDARLRGEPVMFITEGAHLFDDFWRDLEDIDAAHLFKRIFVVNDDVEVTSTLTGEVVAASAPRAEVDRVMRSLQYPEDADIVFATYSQFNRDPIKAIKNNSKINLDERSKEALSAQTQKLMAWVRKEREKKKLKDAAEIVVAAIDVLSDPKIVKEMPLAAVKSVWLGKALKGAALLIDESHNAAGETAQTNFNLMHAVNAAKRVYYSSATGWRDARSTMIYRRLFPASVDVEGLHSTLKRGGEPLQEALAAMLAEDGAFIRREHDLSMVKFEPKIDNQRLQRNEQYADQLAEIVAAMTVLSRESRQFSDALSDELKQALVDLDGSNAKVDEVGIVKRTHIGNNLYMIMRGFMAVMTCELAVDEGVKALKEGRKPIFVLEQTMEAELNRRIEAARRDGLAKETPDGLVIPMPDFRSMLRGRLAALLHVKVDDKDLSLRTKPELRPVIEHVERLIDAFPPLPTSPIDVICQGIERSGYNAVELSGRKQRVRYLGNNQVLVQKIPKKDRQMAVARFNNGDANAIVLTRAGNAGISLHDSPKFLNRAQRQLIEVEVPEDVLARTQFFGRANRNGQLSYPFIQTLSTGLPAQNRVLALQNNKLRKMSASVTGNRDNAAITREVPDVINSVGNEVAYRFLQHDPELAKKLDINIDAASEIESNLSAQGVNLSGDKYISELMNRLVLLPVVQQKAVIEAISQEFKAVIEELDAKGENPLRPKFYDVHAKVVRSEVLEVAGPSTGTGLGGRPSSFDKPVTVSHIEYTEWHEPLPGAELLKRMEEARERVQEVIASKYADVPSYQLWRQANPDADFVDYAVEALIERKERLLSRFLSTDKDGVKETIAQALAKDDNNMVKQLDHKIDSMISVLAVMRAGSRITWYDDFTETKEDHAIVLRILPPEDEDIHHPSRYRVKLAIPGTSFTEDISLSALMEKKHFQVHETEFNRDTLREFDSRKRAMYTIVRPVLDGNLFRASEMSIQSGQGMQAYYSDQNGMVHRAIVMPKDFQPKNFNSLPLRIHKPELVLEFFNAIQSGSLHSTAGTVSRIASGDKAVKHGMSVIKTETEFVVSVPGTMQWVNWLRNNPNLMKVTGPFGGTRTKLFATVPVQDAKALVEAIYATGMTMYAHGTDRYVSPEKIMEKGKYGRPQEVNKSGDVRGWFAERFGDKAIAASDTKDLMPKDAFADADAPGRRLRRAA